VLKEALSLHKKGKLGDAATLYRKILARNAHCSSPSVLFRHELGHAIGIFGHPPGGIMSAPMVGTTASQRDINMLVQLYHLPHGARIEHDGSWKVVQ